MEQGKRRGATQKTLEIYQKKKKNKGWGLEVRKRH